MEKQGRNVVVAAVRSAARASRPIRRHPLFPAIVALWFAALFGLCSLAIRPAFFEALVHASGIERVIPAAAPPLGMTARASIALALALASGMFGALLGRALSAARPAKREVTPRRRDSHPDAPRPRPVSAHAELGESPLPGIVPAGTSAGVDEDEHLAPDRFAAVEEAPSSAPDMVSLELVRVPDEQSGPTPAAKAMPASEPVIIASGPDAPPLGKAAQRIASADLATLTPIELVERLGIAMQRRRAGLTAAPTSGSLPPSPFPRAYFTPSVRVDNERVLRSALATLQKVSGAA